VYRKILTSFPCRPPFTQRFHSTVTGARWTQLILVQRGARSCHAKKAPSAAAISRETDGAVGRLGVERAIARSLALGPSDTSLARVGPHAKIGAGGYMYAGRKPMESNQLFYYRYLLFEASLLRDEGRGGDRYGRSVRAQMELWDQGLYRQVFLRYVRTRAAKRSKRAHPSMQSKHRRAVDLGIDSKIGAMAGVYSFVFAFSLDFTRNIGAS